MTVADLIVRELRAAGVRAIFGVPGGGGNLDLIDAARRASLPFVLTATETAAAIAAIAQAERTGAPGACLTTIGPGASSVVNGVACAWLERAPLIVFTDSLAASQAACEHQRLDHAALLGPVTKSSASIAAQGIAAQIRAAAAEAASGRPGPVHLDCPGDIASAPAIDDAGPAVGDVASGHDATPAAFESLLAHARKPLLVVGLGARRPHDAMAVRRLVDQAGIPALVTYKGKGIVADQHAWFGGVFTNAEIERAIVDESDLIIGLGLDPVELLPRPWPYRAPVVYCGPWDVADRHVPFASRWRVDVAAAAALMLSRLPKSNWDAGAVRAHADRQRRALDVPGSGLTSQRVVEIAAARLAGQGVVTVDAGAHMVPATMLWPVAGPNEMLISNGLSTMGFAVPAAIGAAWLDRDRPAVALTGDGGLLMCAGELLTAARERLRLIVIVFADASLSLIEIKQAARGLPAAGVDLGSTDWAAMARSMNVTAFTASTGEALAEAIDAALRIDGPSVIDARIDGSNYGAMLRAVRG